MGQIWSITCFVNKVLFKPRCAICVSPAAVFVPQWPSRIVVTEAAWIAQLQKYLLVGTSRGLLTPRLAECLCYESWEILASRCQINRLIFFSVYGNFSVCIQTPFCYL